MPKPPKLPPALDESLRAREPDARDLRRLTGFDWLAWCLQRGLSSREVPQRFWLRHDEDEVSRAIVSCQCGSDLTVEIGAHPAKCEGEGCPRWFFYDGTRVLALAGPKGEGLGVN